MPKYNPTIQPIQVTSSNARRRALGGRPPTFSLHFRLSLLCWKHLTVFSRLWAEAQPITGASTEADAHCSAADSTKDSPLSEIYADVCLKQGRPTGKLTPTFLFFLFFSFFFLHDTYSTELPWNCFLCRGYDTDHFFKGKGEKRCLWTVCLLQRWPSGSGDAPPYAGTLFKRCSKQSVNMSLKSSCWSFFFF